MYFYLKYAAICDHLSNYGMTRIYLVYTYDLRINTQKPNFENSYLIVKNVKNHEDTYEIDL